MEALLVHTKEQKNSARLTPMPVPGFAPAPSVDDTPSNIVPRILNDAALTPEERARYILRFIDSRDLLTERKIKYIEQTSGAHHQPVPPMGMPYGPGGYGMPAYPMYPGMPYPTAPQPSDAIGLDNLFDSIASPLTLVLKSVKFVIRSAIVIFSWLIIFYVMRAGYRLFV